MLLRRIVWGGWILGLALDAGPAWAQRDVAVPVLRQNVVPPAVLPGNEGEEVVEGGIIGPAGAVVQVIERGVEVRVVPAIGQAVGGEAVVAGVERPDADADARQQTIEKLRQRVDVRINNKDLKSSLDELAQTHGFEYRFDSDSLEQAGVKPDQAQVGLNVRRAPLVGVLREILQGHGLQFGLDGAVVVIVSQPKLPEGVRRKKPRPSAPVEQVVLGNVLISDDREEAAPAKPIDIQVQMPAMAGNQDQRKQIRLQQIQNFQQMFGAQWKNEVATCLGLAEFSAEQKQKIRKAAQVAFEKQGGEWADNQVLLMFGGGRGPNSDNRSPDIRGNVQKAIREALESLAIPGQVELYQKEVTARNAQRQRATVHNLVSQVDRQLVLSEKQRDDLEALLNQEWQPNWVRALEFLQWEGNNVFPNLPAGSVEKLLSEQQVKIWQGMQRIDLNNIWGGGFNFFNQQQQPEGDEAAAAADQVQVEVLGPAVQVIDAVPVEVKDEEE